MSLADHDCEAGEHGADKDRLEQDRDAGAPPAATGLAPIAYLERAEHQELHRASAATIMTAMKMRFAGNGDVGVRPCGPRDR